MSQRTVLDKTLKKHLLDERKHKLSYTLGRCNIESGWSQTGTCVRVTYKTCYNTDAGPHPSSQVVLKLLGSCWHFESHWTTEQFKKAVKDSRKALWSYCSQAVPEASADSG